MILRTDYFALDVFKDVLYREFGFRYAIPGQLSDPVLLKVPPTWLSRGGSVSPSQEGMVGGQAGSDRPPHRSGRAAGVPWRS